jgi:hypothetical protein
MLKKQAMNHLELNQSDTELKVTPGSSWRICNDDVADKARTDMIAFNLNFI